MGQPWLPQSMWFGSVLPSSQGRKDAELQEAHCVKAVFTDVKNSTWDPIARTQQQCHGNPGKYPQCAIPASAGLVFHTSEGKPEAQHL